MGRRGGGVQRVMVVRAWPSRCVTRSRLGHGAETARRSWRCSRPTSWRSRRCRRTRSPPERCSPRQSSGRAWPSAPPRVLEKCTATPPALRADSCTRGVGNARRSFGAPLAIGLDMFQRPFQSSSSALVAGEPDEAGPLARTEYATRWGMTSPRIARSSSWSSRTPSTETIFLVCLVYCPDTVPSPAWKTSTLPRRSGMGHGGHFRTLARRCRGRALSC
jgi:hypothetical protein